MKKRVLCILMSILMLIPSFCYFTNGASMTALTYELTYNMSEARSILSYINTARKQKGLSSFVYDYGLEQVALTRIKEIVLMFTHTRPDHTSCLTAFPTFYQSGKQWYYAENIDGGYNSAQQLVNEWKKQSTASEEYQNIFASHLTTIGVACVTYDSMIYWVIEFSNKTSSTAYSAPINGNKIVTTNFMTSDIGYLQVKANFSKLSIVKGSSVSLPSLDCEVVLSYNGATATFYDSAHDKPNLICSATWTSANPSVAAISGKTVVGKSIGTTTLTGKAYGKTVTVTVTVEKGVGPFTDVSTSVWYAKGVEYCYTNGYMSGTTATTFSPNGKLTRSQIVVILAAISGEDTTEFANKQTFTDVAKGKWFHNAIEWAASKGITSGTSATTFSPNSPLTRQELATLLYAFAKSYGCDMDKSANISGYSDYTIVSSWARTQLSWAVACGLISGTSTTTISPKTAATRSQAATIIMQLDKNVLQAVSDTDQ